jgi:hypothetical protein
MAIKNFKTNWFSIALVILVLIAISRKKIPDFFPAIPFLKGAEAQKFTDTGKAQLGLFGQRSGGAQPAMDAVQASELVRRFSHVAVSESKKFKVPASVIMGWALVQSQAGTHPMVKDTRNFFGLRCDEDWDGKTASLSGVCYRQYETPWESFRDFSIYISSRDWYADARKNAGKNGAQWAQYLKEKSIGGDRFGQELAAAIQAFGLEKLDQ